jgi:hypothetical protein
MAQAHRRELPSTSPKASAIQIPPFGIAESPNKMRMWCRGIAGAPFGLALSPGFRVLAKAWQTLSRRISKS